MINNRVAQLLEGKNWCRTCDEYVFPIKKINPNPKLSPLERAIYFIMICPDCGKRVKRNKYVN